MQHLLRFYGLLIAVIAYGPCSLYAQNELSVNEAKGLATINIPIHQFNMIDFDVGVGIAYAARGYKPNDQSDHFVGWKMYGGGTIKRIVRGLPDETYSTSDPRRGWMTGLYDLPPTFTPSENGPGDCLGDQANYDWLNTNITQSMDTEPDIFVVQAPGLSCRLVSDKGHFKAIPAQELRVEFLTIGLGHYFVITNTKGIKYTFQYYSVFNKTLNESSNYVLYRTDRNYYSSHLNWPDTWYLTSIESHSSGGKVKLTYSYDEPYSETINKDEEIYIKHHLQDTARASKIFSWYRSHAQQRVLRSISSSLGSKIVFDGIIKGFPDTYTIYNGLESGRPFDRRIKLHDRLAYDGRGNSKTFLGAIDEEGVGCTRNLYKFNYYGLPESGSSQIIVDPKTKRTDAWGFVNYSPGESPAPRIYVYPALKGSTGVYRPYFIPGYSGETYVLPGNDKSANESAIAWGSLSKVTYPRGGSSTLEYESNSFWDEDAQSEIKGGGIRIKTLKHFDGLHTDRILTKNFHYRHDDGRTSGVINILPAYAISTESYRDQIANVNKSYSTIVSSYGINSLDYWNHLTVRTDYDLYEGSSEVSYAQVSMYEDGNGRVTKRFATPLSFWNATKAIPSYTAQICNSGASTFISKGPYQYPFVPAESRSDQQQLLSQHTYNEIGYLLNKKEYSYENYHSSPQRIYAIRRDNNFNLRQVSKYYIELTGMLLTGVRETAYSSDGAGDSISNMTTYLNNAYDRNVSETIRTASDGSRQRTRYQYTGDFWHVVAWDTVGQPYLGGLSTMVHQNNLQTIVEQTTDVMPAGASSYRTVASEAKLFRDIGSATRGVAVVDQIQELRSSSGLNDFTPMYKQGNASTAVLKLDPRYRTAKQYKDFNAQYLPTLTMDSRVPITTVYDTVLRVPMLQLVGAKAEDIAFHNFDPNDGRADFYFYGAGWANYEKDPHFGRSAEMTENMELYKRITPKPEHKLYKVSFIAKSKTATQMRISVGSSAAGSVPIQPSNDWVYYEAAVDLRSISSEFVKLSPDATVIIDNILLHPTHTSYSLSNYHIAGGKTIEMGSGTAPVLYDYDAKGRMLASRHLNGDIIAVNMYNDYKTAPNTNLYSGITVMNPTENYANYPIRFAAYQGCVEGVKYSWNFGDGHTMDAYGTEVSHVYSAAGTYTVTLTVSHPEYTSATSSQSITIKPAQIPLVEVCASGIVRKNTCYPWATVYYNDCDYHLPGEIDSPYGTIFYGTVSGCPANDYTYTWEYSDDGINFYPWMSTPGPELYDFAYGDWWNDYYIRLRVTSAACGLDMLSDPVFIEWNCSVY